MRGIPSAFLMLFFLIVLVVEFLSCLGTAKLLSDARKEVKRSVLALYILISLTILLLLLFSFENPEVIRKSRNYSFFYMVISISFLNLIPKFFFAVSTLTSFLVVLFGSRKHQMIILSGSLILSLGILLVIFWGMAFGRCTIRTEKQELYFSVLPEQLDGLKIVHISDIHLGSFEKDTTLLNRAIQIVNDLQPDILLFTGDIVNNFSDEISGYEHVLSRFSARHGKFAIQGNHDYGDYFEWPDSLGKQRNLDQIIQKVKDSGFEMLLNQSKEIVINDTSFYLLGVENWGHSPFPQYADLAKTLSNVPEKSFKILMTHDPAHWTKVIAPQTDIPLTLSGHTHGGQFGLRIAGIEFSPMFLIEKNWGGLYKAQNQVLYVNRGLGTIGFKGRVEMQPEITLLTLHSLKSVEIDRK